MKDFKTRAQMRREDYEWRKKIDNVMYSIVFLMSCAVFAWALWGFLTAS